MPRLFQPTKDYAEDSIRAVNAYGEIVKAIDKAEIAAGQAMMAANNASYQVNDQSYSHFVYHIHQTSFSPHVSVFLGFFSTGLHLACMDDLCVKHSPLTVVA